MSEAADPTTPEPGAPSEEEQAWERVAASWADEGVHGAYLARFRTLEELAVAGRRYKAVLDERPEDAVALRMRDEVVKKATTWGLASLPRTGGRAIAKLPRGWTLLALAIWIIVVSCVVWNRGRL